MNEGSASLCGVRRRRRRERRWIRRLRTSRTLCCACGGDAACCGLRIRTRRSTYGRADHPRSADRNLGASVALERQRVVLLSPGWKHAVWRGGG
jgi:hypothetical protein